MIKEKNIPDIAALLDIIQQKDLQLEKLSSQLEKQFSQNEKLKHQLDQLLRTVYGKKSERFAPSVLPGQLPLALDVEVQEQEQVTKQTITYERKTPSKKSEHKGRVPLPDHLPRVEIIIEPDYDTTGLVRIGEEVTEQLELDPGQLFVKKFIRPKYALPKGEGIIIGELPSFPIEKGIPGPALLAWIFISKYVDHTPLHRQIEQLKRLGIEIPSSTMSDWVSKCCDLIAPVFETHKKKILYADYLQADESPIKVLDRNKKEAKIHLGYYWVYRDPVNGLVLFDYRKGRGKEGPTTILKNFEGHLQVDGWRTYERFDSKTISLIHCMAHARRYFDQARKNKPKLAEYALTEFQKLYAVERRAREENFTHEQRYELRQKESLPVLQSFHLWLKENITEVAPKSAMGRALSYALTRWEKLMIYAGDGKLEIDNNLVENSIRPLALGRKNYLFAGSHDSADNAAMIYSLVGTCKIKGIDPFAYFKNLFQILPDFPANRLEELLP